MNCVKLFIPFICVILMVFVESEVCAFLNSSLVQNLLLVTGD